MDDAGNRPVTESSSTREIRVAIETAMDIVTARQKARQLAAVLGFSSGDATILATVVSELARNIVLYAQRGEIVLALAERGEGRGLTVIARDEGGGIPDVEQVLRRGYSTSGGLGLGLPGVKLMMDEFELVSEVGKGTVVTVKKWRR